MNQLEILRALEHASRPQGSGKTALEWQEALGVGRTTIDRILRRAQEQKRLIVEFRTQMRRDGRRNSIPVYRVSESRTKSRA
jgi:hypothetical protein